MAIYDLIIIRDRVGAAAPIILTPDMAADPETWADAWIDAWYIDGGAEVMTVARDLADEMADYGVSYHLDPMCAYLGVEVSRGGWEYPGTTLAGVVSELTWRRPRPGEWTVADGTGRVLMTVDRTRHERLPWVAELIDGDARITGRTRHEAAVLALALAALPEDAAERLALSLRYMRETLYLADWEEPTWTVLGRREGRGSEVTRWEVSMHGEPVVTAMTTGDGRGRAYATGSYPHVPLVSSRQVVADVWDLVAPRR